MCTLFCELRPVAAGHGGKAGWPWRAISTHGKSMTGCATPIALCPSPQSSCISAHEHVLSIHSFSQDSACLPPVLERSQEALLPWCLRTGRLWRGRWHSWPSELHVQLCLVFLAALRLVWLPSPGVLQASRFLWAVHGSSHAIQKDLCMNVESLTTSWLRGCLLEEFFQQIFIVCLPYVRFL